MLRVVAEDDAQAELSLDLDAICREGARRMLAAALEAERDAYLASFAEELDTGGHRLVVGNGRARSRVVATGAGPIEVEAPRVNDKRVDEETGERCRFRSQILAPWGRRQRAARAADPYSRHPSVKVVRPRLRLRALHLDPRAPSPAQQQTSDGLRSIAPRNPLAESVLGA